MSRFQRQTGTIRYSISCNFLWILVFAVWITECKLVSHAQTGGDAGVSQFESNLNHLIDILVRNTPITGFNASLYGESPNIAAGYIQCRGDATQAEYSDCSRSLTPHTTGSGVNNFHGWYDMCEFYYQNYSASPILPEDESRDEYAQFVTSCNGHRKIRDSLALQNFLSRLSQEACKSSKKFAKGSVDSSGQKIYGLVQCYIGLSTSNCSYCLSQAFVRFEVLQIGIGSNIYMERCYFIISNEPTYPNTTCVGSTDNSRKLPQNLGIVGSTLVLMALLLL